MAITENVNKAAHPMAAELEAEVTWQAARLAEARALIKNAPIVIAYDNGGGQKGVRKNPAYEAYSQLFASFVKGMQALDQVLENAEPTESAAKMTLADLRVMVNSSRKAAGE